MKRHICNLNCWQTRHVFNKRGFCWRNVDTRHFNSPFLLIFGCWYYGSGKSRASQSSWKSVYGPIPIGKQINHHCDNTNCINFLHMYAGSVSDNVQDMVERGQHGGPKGETHPRAKFTNEQIEEIRHRWANRRTSKITRAELAKEFHCHKLTISRITNRRFWKHVT